MTRTAYLTLVNYFSFPNCLSTTSLLRQGKDKSPVQVYICSCCFEHMDNVCNPGPRPKHVQLCHLSIFSYVVSTLTHKILVKLSRNYGRFHLDQSGSWPSFVYWGRCWGWVWCFDWDWVWVRGWDWDWSRLWTEIESELERELERKMSCAYSTTLTSPIKSAFKFQLNSPVTSDFTASKRPIQHFFTVRYFRQRTLTAYKPQYAPDCTAPSRNPPSGTHELLKWPTYSDSKQRDELS